jgi:hypothetical protein
MRLRGMQFVVSLMIHDQRQEVPKVKVDSLAVDVIRFGAFKDVSKDATPRIIGITRRTGVYLSIKGMHTESAEHAPIDRNDDRLSRVYTLPRFEAVPSVGA